MNSAFAFILSVAAVYLLGSFPTSFILAKALKGIDIREVGSKNAGATNVLRTTGKLPALITLIVDLAKGFLAVTVVASFFYRFLPEIEYDFYRPFLGFVAVAGHIWSVFLRFKGGKGVATTLGVAIGISPLALLPSLAVWLVVFLILHYVSLASILALLVFPISAIFFDCPFYTVLFGALICGLVIFKHSENVKRLVRGVENKTIIFKKH